MRYVSQYLSVIGEESRPQRSILSLSRVSQLLSMEVEPAMCVCVCVCVRERDRDGERDRERERG
jgi:hypothetical protein